MGKELFLGLWKNWVFIRGKIIRKLRLFPELGKRTQIWYNYEKQQFCWKNCDVTYKFFFLTKKIITQNLANNFLNKKYRSGSQLIKTVVKNAKSYLIYTFLKFNLIPIMHKNLKKFILLWGLILWHCLFCSIMIIIHHQFLLTMLTTKTNVVEWVRKVGLIDRAV